ncbi:uncharacterized protein CBL_01178 [Carabus blaptoides fortunei]
MSRLQILTALLLGYLVCVYSEETDAQSRIDDFLTPPHPQNKPPVGPVQNQSYFSRLSSWFFPGDSENKPSAQHSNHAPRPLPGPGHSSPGGSSVYLPQQAGDKKKDCSPCNKEPWIPVVSNYGSKTLIGFVPPSEFRNNGKPNTAYRAPPNNFQPPAAYGTPNVPPSKPAGIYGSPLPPSNHYGPPVSTPTKHGPPKAPSSTRVPSINYGTPIPSNSYGPPSGAPSKFRPPPGHSNSGPPSSPPSKYGLPIQSSSGHSNYGPPPGKYGPPIQPPSKYGPSRPRAPSFIPNRPSSGRPSSKYRPFHPTFSSLPPGKYGPPEVANLLPPPPTRESSIDKIPSTIKFESHITGSQAAPSAFMGPPPLLPPTRPNKYGPPKIYGPPSRSPGNNLELVPPSTGPPSSYGAPDSLIAEAVIPTSNYGSSNNQHHPPNNPSLQNGSEFPKVNPIQFSANEYLQPPPLSSVGPQTFSPKNPGSTNTYPLSQGKNTHSITNSYGPPPSGPILNQDQLRITSVEYLPPPHELPLSTGPDHTRDILNAPPLSQQISNYQNGPLEPIPFPNMSPTFILPIHNARPFRDRENNIHTAPPVIDNVPLHGSNIEVQVGKSGGHIKNILQGNNVEVIKSIPVVDYLSTIEYPATVVHSPIIDLVVNDDQLNYSTESNEDNFKVNLSENPIIVDGDEHRQEASNTHTSVTTHNDTKIFNNNFQPNPSNFVNITPVNKFTYNEKIIISPSIEPSINATVTRTTVTIEPSVQTELDKGNIFNNAFANQLLNQNPNSPPKPFAPSDSNIINLNEQKAENKINQNAHDTNNALFTPPSLDYSNWNPSVGQISTSMVPPPPQNTWISTQNFVPFTTKKPKQIQIIVPYTSNSKIKPLQGNDWHQKGTSLQGRQISSTALPTKPPYNPPLSLFTKLPTSEESQWLKYIDHNFQEPQNNFKSSQTTSPITNIQDFFQDSTANVPANTQHLPFDILKLQKNIDVWTEQEYNKIKSSEEGKLSTSSRFAYSKKIPDEYFTTQSLDVARQEVTTSTPYNVNTKLFHDYVASGTFLHEVGTGPHNLTELPNINNNLLETSLIGSDTTSTQKPEVTSRSPLTIPPGPQSSGKHNATPPTWDKIQVSVSPLTNERVYVVTPQPWERDATTPYSAWNYVPKREIQEINKQLADNARFMFTSPRFSVRPEPAHQFNKSKSTESQNAKIHLVYSDWPELINNLAITGTERSVATVTAHPLLGRMDISAYTPPPEGTVQTFTGHSKVVTAVTASSALQKKTETEDKTFTTPQTLDRT